MDRRSFLVTTGRGRLPSRSPRSSAPEQDHPDRVPAPLTGPFGALAATTARASRADDSIKAASPQGRVLFRETS